MKCCKFSCKFSIFGKMVKIDSCIPLSFIFSVGEHKVWIIDTNHLYSTSISPWGKEKKGQTTLFLRSKIVFAWLKQVFAWLKLVFSLIKTGFPLVKTGFCLIKTGFHMVKIGFRLVINICTKRLALLNLTKLSNFLV